MFTQLFCRGLCPNSTSSQETTDVHYSAEAYAPIQLSVIKHRLLPRYSAEAICPIVIDVHASTDTTSDLKEMNWKKCTLCSFQQHLKYLK